MHTTTNALYHKKVGINPERITKKLIAYAQKFNWHDIDFPASYEDYAIFEKLNEDVALNVLYVPFNEVNIFPEYISKRNFNTKNQVTLLKITDDTGKWHFLALPSILDEDGVKRPTKSLSRLMEGIASKSHGDFYCYGCLHSFCTQSTLKNHVELCKYNDFCKIELPKEGKNIKQYAPGAKSLKMNSVIYADFESILLPYSTCDKENVITKNLNKQVPCGYSINVNNDNNESEQTYYRGESTVATFCKEIRDIAQNLLNIEKKPMEKLSFEQHMAFNNAKYCQVFGKKKNHMNVRDHHHYTGKYRGAAHLICNLRYSTQIDIPVFFHNGTNYDFNLIITELAKEFRSEMRCILLNTSKYMSFSIPIKKEIKKQKEQNEQNEPKKPKKKVITYSLKFIDSAKHISKALSTLVDNLSEINKCNCEVTEDKDIKLKIIKNTGKTIIRTTCKICNSKEDQLLYTLIKNFPSTYKLCNKSTEKFILLLKKGIYPYEYMDSIDRFDEKELPAIEKFDSKLQAKHISENDYKHAKKVWDVFRIKKLGEYHDLYVQADTAQSSDVFENFRLLCLKEYQLEPAYFVSTPSLALETMLKITKSEIELFTDNDMVLMTEKGIRGGLTQVVKKHAIANNKYLPTYDKSKKNMFLQYLDPNNLYGYAMDRTLPLNG